MVRKTLQIATALVVVLASLGFATCWGALGQDKAEVRHNGYLILRVRVAAGGMSAAARADEIELRLQDVMEEQFAHEGRDVIGQVKVRRMGDEVVIGTRQRLLINVTSADARACNSSPESLARQWRQRLVKGLTIATRTG